MTRAEIIERANQALDAAINRCRMRREEILRQRDAAFATVPSVRDALAQHTAALAKAADDFSQVQRDAQQAQGATEADARTAHFDADGDTLNKWRRADDAALAVLNEASAAAQAEYDVAEQSAFHLPTLAEQDQARRNAGERRDAALSTATAKYSMTKNSDYEAYRAATAANLDAEIAATSKARARTDALLQAGTNARDNAIAAADIALERSVQADPRAAAMNETFQQQLTASESDCDREKSAILDQMRRDLASATT
jgi:hypothetical protein